MNNNNDMCSLSLLRRLMLTVLATLVFSAATAADNPIDEIQVTATRRVSNVDTIPTPVSIVDASTVDAAPLLTDALAFAPGVMLQETTPGQGAAIVRGLKGSEVLHLVNGIRLNNAIFRSAPTQYFALVPGASVERIEIVRGSAAALYGSDAVGGVVNVITRTPAFSEDGFATLGDASVSVNSAEALRAASVSFEAADENLAGLLAFDAMRTGDRRIGGGDRVTPSGFEAFGARAALQHQFKDNAVWFADVQLMRQPSTPRVDELIPGFGETEAASEEFFFEPNQRAFLHAGMKIDNGLLHTDWKMDVAWQQIDDDRRTRNRGSTVRQIESNRSDLYHVGLTASRALANASWIVGAEWYHDAVSSSRDTLDLVSGDRLAVTPRFPNGSSLDQRALFAQADWSPIDAHTITAGIRITDLSADTNGENAPALTNTDISGELGWLMRWNDHVTVAANIGRSFRAPNIFDLGASGARPGNRFNIPNDNLQPETAIQYDIGVRYQSERWSVNATVFELDYDDRIASVPTGEQTADSRDIVQNQNISRAKIRGLELDGQFRINDTLAVDLVVNAIRGNEFNPEREAADRIPPANGQLRLAWDTSAETQLSTGITFATGQDRLSARDIRDARINPDGTPGWVSFNISARHQLDEQWSIDAQLDNIFDKQFRVHGSGVDASGINLSVQTHYSW